MHILHRAMNYRRIFLDANKHNEVAPVLCRRLPETRFKTCQIENLSLDGHDPFEHQWVTGCFEARGIYAVLGREFVILVVPHNLSTEKNIRVCRTRKTLTKVVDYCLSACS